MISALISFTFFLLVGLSSAQTLRKYNNRGCQGALAVCSVRTDVGATQNWPQASCCDRGAKKSGSLRITGVQGGVGEISIVYRGNFNNQCSVQEQSFVGSPVGCFTSRALGTGVWLTCAMRYASNPFNMNCSLYSKKRRSLGNATTSAEEGGETESADPDGRDTSPAFLQRPEDPEYLPAGFYDAFERPISEEEYWRQIDWEDTNDAPFVPEDDPNLIESRQDVEGVDITTYTGGQCRSASLVKITEPNKCYQSGNGSSFFVNGLASNCKVVTYTDINCSEDAFEVIQGIRGVGAAGCYDTDNFESAAVICGS